MCAYLARSVERRGSSDSDFDDRPVTPSPASADAARRDAMTRRVCYNVPLRLAVRERLQEAGSSGVLPHGQHRAYRHWSLRPTTIFRIAYYVRSFIHAPASLTRATTWFLSLAFLFLPPFLSLSLSSARSRSLSPERSEPCNLVSGARGWQALTRHRVSGSLPALTRATFHAWICTAICRTRKFSLPPCGVDFRIRTISFWSVQFHRFNPFASNAMLNDRPEIYDRRFIRNSSFWPFSIKTVLRYRYGFVINSWRFKIVLDPLWFNIFFATLLVQPLLYRRGYCLMRMIIITHSRCK